VAPFCWTSTYQVLLLAFPWPGDDGLSATDSGLSHPSRSAVAIQPLTLDVNGAARYYGTR